MGVICATCSRHSAERVRLRARERIKAVLLPIIRLGFCSVAMTEHVSNTAHALKVVKL